MCAKQSCVVLMMGLIVSAGAVGSDRDPNSVNEEILKNPTAKNAPTLVTALRGCGCRPKHHPVRDAVVRVGAPAVPLLVKELKSSDKWAVQLECIYLLGLIGPDAKEAIPALNESAKSIKHLLPLRYIPVTVAAIRADSDALAQTFTAVIPKLDLVNGLLWQLENLAGQTTQPTDKTQKK